MFFKPSKICWFLEVSGKKKILIFRIVGINSPPCFGMDENKGGINQRGGINSRISVDCNNIIDYLNKITGTNLAWTGLLKKVNIRGGNLFKHQQLAGYCQNRRNSFSPAKHMCWSLCEIKNHRKILSERGEKLILLKKCWGFCRNHWKSP